MHALHGMTVVERDIHVRDENSDERSPVSKMHGGLMWLLPVSVYWINLRIKLCMYF